MNLATARLPRILLLAAAALAAIMMASAAVAPARASVAAAPAHSGLVAAQEEEPDEGEQVAPYLPQEEEDTTRETVYIALAVIILVLATLVGIAFGLYGYLER